MSVCVGGQNYGILGEVHGELREGEVSGAVDELIDICGFDFWVAAMEDLNVVVGVHDY